MADVTAAGAYVAPQQVSWDLGRRILWFCFHSMALISLALIAALGAGADGLSPIETAQFAFLALAQFAAFIWSIRKGGPDADWRSWVGLVATTSVAATMLYLLSFAQIGGQTLVAITFGLTTPYLAPWLSSPSGAKGKKRPSASMISGIAIIQMAWMAVLATLTALGIGLEISAPQAVLLYGFVLLQTVAAFWVHAQLDGQLPVKLGGDPQRDHISGLGVFGLFAFIGVVVALGLWATIQANGAYISQSAGVTVIVGLAVAFALVAVAPFVKVGDGILRAARESRFVKGIGAVVSGFDGWLVFSLAGAFGASQETLSSRYALLIGHLLPSAVLGWFLPAPWGLVPLAWAFIGAMSVARRWAWIEEDRENAMLNRRFEGTHIKVGFGQDLRDEALVGFMSLFWLVPLALRQAHVALGEDLFVLANESTVDDFWAWLSFFGTELAKAVPFVDWAEIYQVRGDAPIHLDDSQVGPAQHVIFGTRIVVDLVFLAALLQAISISQRTSKLKEMFYKDGTLNRLDPFTELNAFKNLVEGERGNWRMKEPVPDPFLSYDEDRLEELQIAYEHGAVGFAAGELIRRNELRTPELLVVSEVKRPLPDVDKIEEYLEATRARGDALSVHDLKAAHYILNAAAVLKGVREQIARVVADNWRAKGAVSALCDMIIGPARDGRGEVRAIALQGLYAAAVAGDPSARTAIKWAADKETANRPRDLAGGWLKEHPDWT